MVMISERPAEAADRAVPGHWEGDLILGEGGRSAVGTLVERTTRLVLLLHLDGRPLRGQRRGRDAQGDRDAARGAARARSRGTKARRCRPTRSFTDRHRDPDLLLRSALAVAARLEREHKSNVLRQYLPKGTDLSEHSAADLQRIQRSLNGRPRKTLGYMTPSEAYAQVVAATA